MEALFTEPPKEVLERHHNHLSDFIKVLKDMSDEDSLIREQNDVEYLFHNMFNSHPKVHRGYYDKIENGVLYVKDILGNFIRKDESLPLVSGEFCSENYEHFISSLVNVDSRIKHMLHTAMSPTATKEEKEICNKYITPISHVNGTRVYSRVNIDNIVRFTDPLSVSRVLTSIFVRFCDTNGTPSTPLTVQDFNLAGYLRYLDRDFKAELKSITQFTTKYAFDRSKDLFKEFFDGVYLKFDGGSSLRPIISINSGDAAFYTNSSRCSGRTHHIELNPDVYTFDLMVTTRLASPLTKSKKTLNNEGVMLYYSQKVDAYKVPFKMLEDEKRLFDFYEEEFLKSRKTNPKAIKHPEQNPIFLGLELEVIAKPDLQDESWFPKLIKNIADSKFGDHAIIKSDSSLHSRFGMEIVTIPATLAYHKKMFEDNFFSKPNAFHTKIMSNANCGIHVHISKNVLTPLKWGQFIDFINSSENKTFIDAMANRPPNIYCVRQKLTGKNKFGVNVSAKIVARACKGGVVKNGMETSTRSHDNFSRRIAVNSDNGQTMEVRMFKSSTDKNNILRKMEFCESLVRFVRNHSTQQMTVYDYVNFIIDSANKKEYPYLVKWLASKNYIGHTRKRIQGKNKLVHVYGTNNVPKPKTIYHQQKETN